MNSSPPAICIQGIGAISPAGWGVPLLRQVLAAGQPVPPCKLARPGWEHPLTVRQTPPPATRPAFLSHARLRRTSPIARYVVAAALEALGTDAQKVAQGFRLGIVFCAMSGCVNYSRRFYSEVLNDPSTASPLVFPETVFNSPASHLASLLGTLAINYTIVGDPGTFVQGIALAADWLAQGRVDGCLVIGAEEMDWLLADATRRFERSAIISDGAGALYLKSVITASDPSEVRLSCVTDAEAFHGNRSRAEAVQAVRNEMKALHRQNEILFDSRLGIARADRDESAAWSDWTQQRVSVKSLLGEGYMAAAAWQCVAAVDALQQGGSSAATVNVVGANQQAIAAQFVRYEKP
ncbi:MAG TPA: hypothetical protein VEH04_10545 [Verrucomicrobiae bacterium]|nr:hypothetical protein [Verrucomicrobiae bacterium]